MRVACAVVIAIAGCYGPVPATGIPCAANGECPAPLLCDRARAVPTCEAQLSDAAPGGDAPLDAAIQIDAPTGTIDAPLAPCLVDDFNDGDAADWTIVDPAWAVLPNQGPDGSSAFLASPTAGDRTITHPGLRSVKSAQLSLDFRIDSAAAGDFNIYLIPPGWTDPNGPDQSRRSVAFYVLGGDSGPNDRISRIQPPIPTVEVATHVVSVPASVWHHLELRYLADGSIRVDLDGALYMASPPDTLLPGPLDLLIRFWAHGAIDNVRLDCTR